MGRGKIGEYKGRIVYKVPHRDMEENDSSDLFAVAETGELVFRGTVVGKVNFEKGIVTEYDEHRCYPYVYPRRVEVEVEVETDVEDMIDSFIEASRNQTIEDLINGEV